MTQEYKIPASQVSITLVTKESDPEVGRLVGFIGFTWIQETNRGMVLSQDPRTPLIFNKEIFENKKSTAMCYHNTIEGSLENGWKIIYQGPPLFG